MTTQPSKSAAQGGFLHGIPQVSDILREGTASGGCCGATNQATTSGCCSEPVVQVSSALVGVQAAQGCCGEPLASTTGATLQASGCCGEPVSGSSSAQKGCCN